MVDDETLGGERLAKALDHPVRQRIIDLLGEQGPLTWKALSSELGIGTGSLYHHVDALEGIVVRDSQKRFALTRAGQELFVHLQKNPLSAPLPEIRLAGPYGPGQRLLSTIFWPRALINRLASTRGRAIVTLGALSALFLGISYLFGDGLSLFFLSPVSGPISIVVGYLMTLFSLLGVSYLATRVFFGATPGVITLLAACAFSLVPIVAFMSGASLLQTATGTRIDRNAFTVLVVFFQSWSAGLLGAGISVSSGLRIEKSILVSLIVLYATMAVLFVQGSVLI